MWFPVWAEDRSDKLSAGFGFLCFSLSILAVRMPFVLRMMLLTYEQPSVTYFLSHVLNLRQMSVRRVG